MTNTDDRYKSQAKLINDLMEDKEVYDGETEFLIAQLTMATDSAGEIAAILRKMQLGEKMKDGAVPWDEEDLKQRLRGEVSTMAAVSFLMAHKFDVDIWEGYTDICTDIAKVTTESRDE